MEINNHIGIFKNAYTPEECDKLISIFKTHQALGTTQTRLQSDNLLSHAKSDRTLFMFQDTVLKPDMHSMRDTTRKIWGAYDEYSMVYSLLREQPELIIYSMRLQRTTPGEAYHTWHYERSSSDTARRIVTFILYLNDVEEGGETEFLHFPLRFKPERGTLLIWPAAYTHAHRGNQPLSGDKYILTGWIDMA